MVESPLFDVFLCHNSQDKPEVREIARQLQKQGLKPWLDEWELRPGLSWQELLEEQIKQIKSAAVFVGSSGFGPWQKREMRAFLSEFVDRGCPVIPVLLENAPQKPELPIFLKAMTWVDFRHSESNPMERLNWGITGVKPDRFNTSQRKKSPSNQIYEFDVKTVDATGQEVKREKGQARYFTENLGNNITLDMVAIPGGKFMMGTEDSEIERLCKKYDSEWYRKEKPQHEVTVQPFFMGKFQITQAQWKAIAFLPKIERDLEPNSSRFKGDNYPVETVSWEDAVEFCQRLSKQKGKEYRLPTEAEWEYACRAETITPFHFGETITTDLANYNGNNTYASGPEGEYRQQTTTVGSFPPNAFGLYDLHGNVWEWCEDNWHKNYEGAPTDGSAWLSGQSNRKVVRGGSWNNFPDFCRSAFRVGVTRDDRDNVFGFRVVCVAPRTT